MIDILLCFPSRGIATQVGMALGYSELDGENNWKTKVATQHLAICVLGEHNYVSNDEHISDGKWWVMVRSLIDIPIPQEIQQFIVVPDPNNPLIPNAKWA